MTAARDKRLDYLAADVDDAAVDWRNARNKSVEEGFAACAKFNEALAALLAAAKDVTK